MWKDLENLLNIISLQQLIKNNFINTTLIKQITFKELTSIVD